MHIHQQDMRTGDMLDTVLKHSIIVFALKVLNPSFIFSCKGEFPVFPATYPYPVSTLTMRIVFILPGWLYFNWSHEARLHW